MRATARRTARRVGVVLALTATFALVVGVSTAATSRALGVEYTAASAESPALRPGSLAIFAPVDAGSLQRGDIVRFTPAGSAAPVTRVISAFGADGSMVTRPSGTAPADAELTPAIFVRQRLWFTIPFAGYAAEWLGGHGITAAASGPLALWGSAVLAPLVLLAFGALYLVRGRRNETRLRTQPRLRKIRYRDESSNAGVPAESAWDGIVTRIHSDEESYAVRFPLRRQRPNEFSLADGSGENVRTDAVVAERAGVPRSARRDRGQERLVQEHVASSLTGTGATEPQERLTFAQLRAVPPAELPPPSVEEQSPFPRPVAAAKETTEPLASSLFTIPLRGQSSASDARADRLV
ncbi:MAG TPA: hypothetical protein VN697_00170, partial [Tepidiformaceae bacterium]|nr:hypothetical protein [Tepidiformaceae bacterium]